MPREKMNCPFCEGGGCCFCDYEGHIFVGENEEIKSKGFVNSIGFKVLKKGDEEYGDLENDKEMFSFFLDEKNQPFIEKNFKNYIN